MTKQAQNFTNLVKGNSPSQVITALRMVAPKVKNELMAEYNAKSVEELALKLCI